MGQRLVIHCMNGNEELANCYYHWSGYTDSTISHVQQVIHSLEKKKAEKDLTLRCVRAFQDYEDSFLHVIDKNAPEKMTAILTGKDKEEAKNRWPGKRFKKNGDRNTGLISITEEGMEESSNWSEADAFIDLANKTFRINAFNYADEADYEEYYKDEDGPSFETYVNQDNVLEFDADEEYDWKFIDEYAETIWDNSEFYSNGYLISKIE